MTQHRTQPPDHDRDFHQLTGAFDRPVAPSPAFAERLRQQIAQSGAEKGVPTMQAVQTANPHVSRITTGHLSPMPDRGRRLVRILEATAAAILILALIGGSLFLNRNGSGNDDRIRLAAVTGTTPQAEATPAPTTSAFTDPGHTNAYPAGFDPEAAHPAERLGDLDFKSDSGIIVGDTLILFGRSIEIPQDAMQMVTSEVGVDLHTGGKLWSRESELIRPQVAGMESFYTIETTRSENGSRDFTLISASPETGLPIWEHTLLTLTEDQLATISENNLLHLPDPIAIGNSVYIANSVGDVTAFDAESGQILWQTGETSGAEQIGALGGSLVGDSQHLYVVDGENEIRKLDRTSGEILERFPFEYRPAPYFILDLHLANDRLIIIAQDAKSIEDPNTNVLLQVLDAESGEAFWGSNLAGYMAGRLAITDTAIVVPEYIDEDATPATSGTATSIETRMYDLETGDILGDMESPLARGASVSASGSVICIHDSSPRISCDDIADGEFTPHDIDLKAEYEAEGPPSPVLFWHDSAIVLGHHGGPYIIRSGINGPSPNATPTASPSP